MKTATPLSRNSLIFLNNLSVESKSSAAEDSSKINTFVFSRKNALPIVIHALIGNDKLNTVKSYLMIGCVCFLNGLFLVNSPSVAITNEPLNSPVYFGFSSVTSLEIGPNGVTIVLS